MKKIIMLAAILATTVFVPTSRAAVAGTAVFGGTVFTTIQDAVTAACLVGGGTISLNGIFTQSATINLCSNLNLIGSGSAQADTVTCPTSITSSVSAELFLLKNINDSHFSDFCVTGSGDTAFKFASAQRNTLERVFISGQFNTAVSFISSSTSNGSTIWNNVRDIHCNNLNANGIGILFDSQDATTKVINSNTLWNDHCTGGTGGNAIKFTNSLLPDNTRVQIINENIINCSECSAFNGTAILINPMTTRGTVFIDTNAEGSTVCLNKALGNTITFIGGNFSACSTNVIDAQPAFTSFIGTNVAGTIQELAFTPGGGIYADGIGLNGNPVSNSINGAPGWNIRVAGSPVATFSNVFPHVAVDNLKIAVTPVGALPTCTSGLEGSMVAVSGAAQNTWGSTLAGLGSFHVLAYCDGSNWTVGMK